MDEHIELATLYIWGQGFDTLYLTFILGGKEVPRDDEIVGHRPGNPMYCTSDFRIYPVSKEQDEETRRTKAGLEEWNPHFKTINLEERMKKYRLEVPDYEVVFCPRGMLNTDPVNIEKVVGAAVHLEIYNQLKVLAVPGTSIEENQLYASKKIAEALGMEDQVGIGL